jgi:hypothetical protein
MMRLLVALLAASFRRARTNKLPGGAYPVDRIAQRSGVGRLGNYADPVVVTWAGRCTIYVRQRRISLLFRPPRLGIRASRRAAIVRPV